MSSYRPVFDPLVIASLGVLAGVALVAVAWLGDRGRGVPGRVFGLVARGVAAAVLLWILAGPTVIESADTIVEPGSLIMLVDTSQSMSQRDVTGEAGSDTADQPMRRIDQLAEYWLSRQMYRRLSGPALLERITFDQSARPLPGSLARSDTDQPMTDQFEPKGKATRLFATMRSAVGNRGSNAGSTNVLVLSDGHDTDRAFDGSLLDRLASRGVTVHTATFGQPVKGPNLTMQAWADADFLLHSQSTTIHAQVLQQNLSGRDVRVSLYEDDRLVSRRTASLGSGQAPQVEFPIEPDIPEQTASKLLHYRVVTELIGTVGSAQDDVPAVERHVFIKVSRRRLRVLVLEGDPHWETRALVRVLARDPQVRLTAVYDLGRAGRTVIQSTGRPVRADADLTAEPATGAEGRRSYPDQAQLNEHDVVVLGRGCEVFFAGERAQLLVDFVRRRGGAMLMLRGEPFDTATSQGRLAASAIQPISPVTFGRRQIGSLQLAITESGRSSGVWRDDDGLVELSSMPNMIAATRTRGLASASVVLVTHDRGGQSNRQVAIATMRSGRGRVLCVLTEGMSRWTLLPGELSARDSVYASFWRRGIEWLATGGAMLPGQQATLLMDRLSGEPGESIGLTVERRSGGGEQLTLNVRVTGPDGHEQSVALTQSSQNALTLTGSFTPSEMGIYRVELTGKISDTGDEPDGQTAVLDELQLAVYDQSPEQLAGDAQPQVMAAMARRTNGLVLAPDGSDVDRLIDHLQKMQLAGQTDPSARYDFQSIVAAVLLVGLLAIEWWRRRRAGLS